MARPGSAVTRAVMPASAHAARTAAAPLGDRRGRLALDVGHAEAAADRQLGQAVGVDEGGQHLDGLVEEVDDEDLAADVGVQPDQVDRGRWRRRARRPRRRRRTGRPKPNLESSWPVRTYSWVWASTPGVTRTRTWGAARRTGGEALEAVDLVEGVDDDAADPGVEGPGAARRRTCCCRAGPGDRRARRRPGPRAARRRWPRRGACPPRGRAGPSPGRGRPWSRRPRPRRRRRPPRGSGPAGGPRRRRTAGVPNSAARSRRSQPPMRSRPSSPTVGGVGQQRRAGSGGSHRLGRADPEQVEPDGQADPGRPRPATGGPGSARDRRRRPPRSSRGRSRGTRPASSRTQVVILWGARSTVAAGHHLGQLGQRRAARRARARG